MKTPLRDKLHLNANKNEVLANSTPCRQFIGMLSHLVNTVLQDSTYAIGYYSHFMHKPRTSGGPQNIC